MKVTVIRYERYGEGNCFDIEGLDGGFIFSGGKTIVRLVRGNTMEESRLDVFFLTLIPEGEVTTLWGKGC